MIATNNTPPRFLHFENLGGVLLDVYPLIGRRSHARESLSYFFVHDSELSPRLKLGLPGGQGSEKNLYLQVFLVITSFLGFLRADAPQIIRALAGHSNGEETILWHTQQHCLMSKSRAAVKSKTRPSARHAIMAMKILIFTDFWSIFGAPHPQD